LPRLKATALPTIAGEAAAGSVLGRAANSQICHLLRVDIEVSIRTKYNQERPNWYNLFE
jgi:hypothetical protein